MVRVLFSNLPDSAVLKLDGSSLSISARELAASRTQSTNVAIVPTMCSDWIFSKHRHTFRVLGHFIITMFGFEFSVRTGSGEAGRVGLNGVQSCYAKRSCYSIAAQRPVARRAATKRCRHPSPIQVSMRSPPCHAGVSPRMPHHGYRSHRGSSLRRNNRRPPRYKWCRGSLRSLARSRFLFYSLRRLLQQRSQEFALRMP